MILSIVKLTSGNILLKMSAANQWVEQLLSFSKPVEASKNAPVQILAISEPCAAIFITHLLSSSTCFILCKKSGRRAGMIIKLVRCTSAIDNCVFIENKLSYNFTDREVPAS